MFFLRSLRISSTTLLIMLADPVKSSEALGENFRCVHRPRPLDIIVDRLTTDGEPTGNRSDRLPVLVSFLYV